MIHIAILKLGYIRDILESRKTIESRLTKTNQPPHGRVEIGERLFLKASGGPFMATAIASKVQSWSDLTVPQMHDLEKKYRPAIGGDDDYWQSKRNSRYATLIHLDQVEPIDVGPSYKVAYMKAWYVLDEVLSPLRDYIITDGALRNRYACIPRLPNSPKLKHKTIKLLLPDGSEVTTHLVNGNRIQWREWGPIYEDAKAKPGDVLRFLAMGNATYRIQLLSRLR